METLDISYAGQTVTLADLPEYRKFYRKLAAGTWEPRTFDVLSRNLDRNTVCVDIGAWIGVTPLWAAGRAKAVIAVEPDPKCIAILRALSGQAANVTVLEGAISDRPNIAINAVEGFGSSETSALDVGDGELVVVRGLGIDTIMRLASGAPAFVKIDIEGYEFALREELGKLRGYDVRGVQLALHPQLYERTLSGSLPWRRLRTAYAVWRLARTLGAFLPPPRFAKFGSLADYLLRGVVFRRVPKGADIVFERAAAAKQEGQGHAR